MRLAEGWEPLTTPWSYRCLVKLCASVADRVCLRACAGHPEALAQLMPRLQWLYPEVHDHICSWRGLDRRWPTLKRTVLDALDNRLEALAELEGLLAAH